MKQIFIISNMFPSEKHPYYGIFVKNFIKNFYEDKCIRIKNTATIKGKKDNFIKKLIAYALLNITILLKGILFRHDIIYVHYLKYTTFSAFLIKLLKPKTKLIYNCHGNDVLDDNSSQLKINKFKYTALSICDGIILPSNYFAEIISTSFPTLKTKIFISPSGGIDEKIFFKEKIPHSSNVFKIGYVGRIDKGKGIETLLKAVEHLEKKNIKFRLDIIGSGSLETVLKENINKNLKPYVIFHGAIPQNMLTQYYNDFDIFVFPTERLNESLGLVGLESLACGTPVIGSNIGEIKSYIKDDYNGYLFNCKDHDMLAEKLLNYDLLPQNEKDRLSLNAIESSKIYRSQAVHNNLSNFLLSLK